MSLPLGHNFSLSALLCLVSVCSPAALGEPTGEDLGLWLSILAAAALVLGPAGDAEEEEGRSAEKEEDHERRMLLTSRRIQQQLE